PLLIEAAQVERVMKASQVAYDPPVGIFLQLASSLSAAQPGRGVISDEAHERQHGSLALVSQAVVDRGMREFAPTNQPTVSSLIEQSLSSLRITIATAESGRRKALRCVNSV